MFRIEVSDSGRLFPQEVTVYSEIWWINFNEMCVCLCAYVCVFVWHTLSVSVHMFCGVCFYGGLTFWLACNPDLFFLFPFMSTGKECHWDNPASALNLWVFACIYIIFSAPISVVHWLCSHSVVVLCWIVQLAEAQEWKQKQMLFCTSGCSSCQIHNTTW